jgi:hypothetical protein
MGENDDIYKERNETRKAWRKVCGGPKEGFEAPGDVYDNSTKTTWQ